MTYAPNWDWQDGDALPGILFVCGALLIGSLVGPTPTRAQTPDDAEEPSLIQRYQRARQRALARRHLQQKGRLPMHPPVQVPTPTDSLQPQAVFTVQRPVGVDEVVVQRRPQKSQVIVPPARVLLRHEFVR